MKRRQFITLAGIGTGLLILPPVLYTTSPSLRKYAGRLILDELYYLKINPKEVEQYVEDYFNASGNNMMVNLKWKSYYFLRFNAEKSNQILELIKYFLLSSDFFIHKTDESKPVSYLGLYNPYKSPIPNPYSFVLYPSETSNT